MRRYTEDFKPEEQGQKLPPLPAGAYVAVILGVRLEEDIKGQTITLQVDVTEGDYKGYYYKQYRASEGGKYPQRYKGVFRMTAPNQGNEYYDIQDRVFRNSIWAIEQSNAGYVWDWDENTLKNKLVGIVVRERDWEKDGMVGTTTEIGCLTPVKKVRDGTAPQMKKRELKHKPESSLPAGYVPVSNEPLPF